MHTTTNSTKTTDKTKRENNYYSYSDLYADTRKWVKENWIDYILLPK